MTLSTEPICHFAECLYAECHTLFFVMLNVIMLSVIMLNVVMLEGFAHSFSSSLAYNTMDEKEKLIVGKQKENLILSFELLET
jgi:hypothetical protein